MADDPNILDTVISWLEKEKRQGRRRIRLSAGAQRVFAETKPSAGAARSAPAPGGTPGGSGRDAHAPVGTARSPDRPTATPSYRHTATPVPAPAPALQHETRNAQHATVSDIPSDLSMLDLAAYTLETLPAAVAACKRCRLHALGRTRTVFSDGSPTARLMFIGEGPGADEDAQGVPFVGAAGQLLTRMIEAMRLKRGEVYIANIVKCRPPGNRTPLEDEGGACLPYVQRQVELVKPEVIVVLGATPFLHLLGQKGIMAGRGKWYDYRGIPVMATYHPAFLLRMSGKKAEAWADLQQVMKKLGIQ